LSLPTAGRYRSSPSPFRVAARRAPAGPGAARSAPAKPLNTAGAAGRGPAVDGGGGRGDNGSAAPPRRGAGTAFYPWGKLFDGPVPAEPARRPGVAARRPPAGVPAAG